MRTLQIGFIEGRHQFENHKLSQTKKTFHQKWLCFECINEGTPISQVLFYWETWR